MLQDPLWAFRLLLAEKMVARGCRYKIQIDNDVYVFLRVTTPERQIFSGRFEGAEFVFSLLGHQSNGRIHVYRVDTADPSFSPDAFLDAIIDEWKLPDQRETA